jgi:Kef-type K+ transport system membrane component KefB
MTFSGAHFASLNPLTAFGILLALGILGGQFARRSVSLPTLTGYMLTGLIIGPHGLNLVGQPLIDASDLFVQLALGLALFELGRRVDLHWIGRERALLFTAIAGALLCFLGVFFALGATGATARNAAIVAAFGLASAPAALLEVIRETRAEGQVSERLVAYAAIGNLLALIAFVFAIAWSRFDAGQAIETTLLDPAWMLLGSSLVGLCAGMVAIRTNPWIGARHRESQEVLLFGLIALTVGLCVSFKLQPAIALLIFGLSTRNLRQGYTVSSPYLVRHSVVFFVVLFVCAGAQLNLGALYQHIYLAPLIVLLRSGIQILVCRAGAHANGLSGKNGALMGLALMPMSGTAGMLLLAAASIMPQTGGELLSLVVAMLCLTEIAGPVVTRLALVMAGETRQQD